MRIAIGCTPRGFREKLEVASFLRGTEHDVEDLGCDGASAKADCIDIARPLTAMYYHAPWDLAILIGRDGAAMCIAANKFRGVRAAVADDEFTAAFIRARYHCNVLCLGAERHGPGEAPRIVASFLATQTAGGPHARLAEELGQIEAFAVDREPAAIRRLVDV